jgi:Rps23 Pro-64 3,4-dihydroxylase Tpa1-like proline 4-hydroxylase
VLLPNILPREIADKLAHEFPGIDDIDWLFEGAGSAKHTADKHIEKVSSSREALFPPLIRHVMHEFNSGTFLEFLEALTGFQRLIPDPSFGGCGLHSTGRGGRLMVHADSSRHPNPTLHQIINMIYYITPDWQDEWGGDLELWDEEARQCVKKVKPEFNSMLIFFTGIRCYHGHPHPITSPDGVRRNSMASYYYTTDRPLDGSYAGYTDLVNWIPTNELDKNMKLSTRVRQLKMTKAVRAFVRELRR